MKKKHIVIISILIAAFAFGVIDSVTQAKRISDSGQKITDIKKEIKVLKAEMTKKQNTNQKLREEIESTAEQLKNRKAEEEHQEIQTKKRIAIDPGHQGYQIDMSDTEPLGPGSQEMKVKSSAGTQGKYTGIPEYELNLNISKQLLTELEKRGYAVMLTRTDNDTAISNRERALLAAEFGADIFVRIHANGSESSSANGAMTMVPSLENPFVSELHEKSYALGEAIINAYCQSCGMKNNGVQLYDNMTGINWSTVPVTILEMGFMTNESDDRNMQAQEFQDRMVQGIANGIEQYFEAGN